MIENVWQDTFAKLEKFTEELEKAKTYTALTELKPLWRIMQSVQLRHLPTLEAGLQERLSRIVERLEIRDVAPSAWPAQTAIALMSNLSLTCSIDPTSLGID